MVEFSQLAGLGFAADAALARFLALFPASGRFGLMPVVEIVVSGGVNVFCLGMAGIALADVVNITRYAAVARAVVFSPLVAKGVSFARLFLIAHRAKTVVFTFALTGSGGFYCPLAPSVLAGGRGVVSLFGMAGIMGTGVHIVALCDTGGEYRTGFLIVMAEGGNLTCPSAGTAGFGCSVRRLVFANIICRALFSAGGFFGNGLG